MQDFLFVWYMKTQYRLVIHAVLCYNMLLSMYDYMLALKGAGIEIKNNVGIYRKVMWIEAGTIQLSWRRESTLHVQNAVHPINISAMDGQLRLDKKCAMSLMEKTQMMKAASSGTIAFSNIRILFRCV